MTSQGDAGRLGELVRLLNQKLEDKSRSLARMSHLYRVLSGVNRALALSDDEPALLDRVCRNLVFAGGFQLAWVGFENDGELRCVAQASTGCLEHLGPLLLWSLGGISPGAGDPLFRVLRTGRWRVVQHPAAGARTAPDSTSTVLAAAAFPLRIAERTVGALFLYSDDEREFEGEVRQVLAQIAQDTAFGLAVLRDRASGPDGHGGAGWMLSADPVTGVSNYTHFEAQLEIDLAAQPELYQQAVVFVVGVHRLWEINDSLGLDQGDVLLRDVGERLQAVLPADARIARLRGDEFVVFKPIGSAEGTEAKLQRFMHVLREPFTIRDVDVEIHATLGYALYPADGRSVARLVRSADIAMRRAQAQRDRIARYDPEHDGKGPQRLALAAGLRRALEADEFSLDYQLKVSVADGRICGAEALIRWEHPARGRIPPDEFIALAEQTGLIGAITEWVIERSLRQAAVWREAGLDFPIAVNLSGRDLRNEALPDRISTLLDECGALGSWLELEITEGAVIEDPEGALEILERLSSLGITLYIDDFGTGYSSLGYLKRLPVDAIKIDKSFVIDMLEDTDSAAIVRSLIGMAHDLGLKVVAEGVEDEATWETLVKLGCDAAQGYYISRPARGDQLLAAAHRLSRGSEN